MEFIQEPKELGFTLEPPVVFYRIFVPCAILSTESSKQRLPLELRGWTLGSLPFKVVIALCVTCMM